MKRLICVISIIVLFGTTLFAQTAFADKPAILTSIGQSADMEMIRVLLTRAGIPFKGDAVIQANELGSGDKTLILVIGGSSKGLGAAGISVEDEMKRTQALVSQAQTLSMKIIAVHVGGEARRGSLSDGFIKYAVPLADYVIVVSDGDKDGLISGLARDAKIPINKVDRISSVGAPLAASFR